MSFSSKKYWEIRYKSNGNSGSGSYGILATYKAKIINDFIQENSINSVVEFGCGDGNQLSMLNCANYIGYDVSETVINMCREKFKNDSTKNFYLIDDYYENYFDLSLSLDVIFHLVENEIFENYMKKLFNSANHYVIIYSSNGDILQNSAPHLFDRNFTSWVDKNIKEFFLINKIINPYKYNKEIDDQKNTSISDFYIYKKY